MSNSAVAAFGHYPVFAATSAEQARFVKFQIDRPIPNPEKPEKLPQRLKGTKKSCLLKSFFVSWWRKCFATKCKKITSNVLNARWVELLKYSFVISDRHAKYPYHLKIKKTTAIC